MLKKEFEQNLQVTVRGTVTIWFRIDIALSYVILVTFLIGLACS
jgi:hypothetical protein